jgi:predicted MPP superfamily phosphohydrolase
MPTKPRRQQPVRIQFVSDLHLEFERRPEDRLQLPIAPCTTALVLAGDIHNDLAGLDSFVRPLAKRVPVILVAGNHEFFTHELVAMYHALTDWAAATPNVHFLQDRAVEIDGIIFLGSTLWSNFDYAHAALMKQSTSMMVDYAVIADRDDPRGHLRPERILREHQHSIAFLERELRARDPSRTVVVTHHAPSLQSSRCKGEDWENLYGSNYDALIEDCGPALWIHGHVHDSFDYTIGRTTGACNPRDYVGYGENAAFGPSRAFTI